MPEEDPFTKKWDLLAPHKAAARSIDCFKTPSAAWRLSNPWISVISTADGLRICKKAGLKLLLSDSAVGLKYPNDCGFCAAISGKNIICRRSSTDREILGLACETGYKVLNVPQGYSKCSCAILADGAIITADRGIASVTLKNGIDTLLISEGHVDLPGYSYGFIGGATGLCGDTLYFCGDIKTHPDHDVVVSFALKHKTKCVSLGHERLYDVGSLIFI